MLQLFFIIIGYFLNNIPNVREKVSESKIEGENERESERQVAEISRNHPLSFALIMSIFIRLTRIVMREHEREGERGRELYDSLSLLNKADQRKEDDLEDFLAIK